MNVKRQGICALTGVEGKFVKSHILPQALTRPSVSGAPLLQSSKGKGFKRRWSSWYDAQLVTAEGEDLLSRLDDRAIKIMRRYHLVWESWVVFKPYFEVLSPALPNHSYRKVSLSEEESRSLHHFFISIAWRVSASRLHDLSEVKLPIDVEEDFRIAVIDPKSGDWRKYPVSLTQLTTKGEKHNHSPYLTSKVIPAYENRSAQEVPFMRVFLDGLIAHVHYKGCIDERAVQEPLFLCGASHLMVPGITYEASAQYENMLIVAMESFAPFDRWWTKQV